MTNEEYLKSLSTEELACFIHEYCGCGFCEAFIVPSVCCNVEEAECSDVFIPRNIKEWLQSERVENAKS